VENAKKLLRIHFTCLYQRERNNPARKWFELLGCIAWKWSVNAFLPVLVVWLQADTEPPYRLLPISILRHKYTYLQGPASNYRYSAYKNTDEP
jgi:hypothetical protein